MTVSIEKARAFLAHKKRIRQEQLDKRYALAVADCSAIVRMMITDFRPRRIIQWGSLLKPEHFREYSDIDLAVEGVREPERFFEMFKAAERLTDFPLDLLDIDSIDQPFADIIRQKGIVIYECRNQPADQ